MSKLIYCKNKSMYKSVDRSLLWNCFITDSLLECKTYLSLYQPKVMILSNDIADEAGDLIKFLKTIYDIKLLFFFIVKGRALMAKVP